MVTKVVMPKLSLTMKEGSVGKWYKKEGEPVEKGEPIVEIVSEKATYDLEAPASGVLRKIFVEEGVDALVNAVLAVITLPNETYSEIETAAETAQMVEETRDTALASPAAKRLAKEHNVDLSQVVSSGPEGRIIEEDIRKFVEKTTSVSPRVKEVIQLSGFRKTSAERVSTSFKTAPHSTVVMDVDVSKTAKLHGRLDVSYTTILVGAVAKALVEHLAINSTFEGDRIKVFADVNVGVAVATEYGLVVPVIKNADKKSLKEIDEVVKQLSEKAKQEKLSREEVVGGTFTITNLGMYDVDFFVPIINPPEAAILGVGRMVEKPVVVNGKIETRSMMTLSLSYDHRVVDGAPAATFLQKVKRYLENPEILV